MAKNPENTEKTSNIISNESINNLTRRLSGAERRISEIISLISGLEVSQAEKRSEEERLAREAEETEKAAESAQESEGLKTALDEPAASEGGEEKKTSEESESHAETPADAFPAKQEDAPVLREETKEEAPQGGDLSRVAASEEQKKVTLQPQNGQRAEQGQAQPQKPGQPQGQGAQGQKSGQKTWQSSSQSRPQGQGQGQRQGQGQGQGGNRPQGQGQQPQRQGQGGNRPQGQGQGQGQKGPRPAGQQGAKGGFAAPSQQQKGKPPEKKKGADRVYVDRDKQHTAVNKRALVRQQGASVDDFDEDKSGYRKLRKKGKKITSSQIKIDYAVVTTSEIPLKTLSEKLGISAVDITKRLFREGIMKTVNESIDYDTAAVIAADLGIELEYKPEKSAEEKLMESHADTVEEIDKLVPRAPVVTVMGHVDHGKTSLLDKIRNTSVTSGEAGGITQHIGAYSVTVGGKSITFIDTPGHEAFTAMRARGAKVTDIVILVVAADDGVMPQTIEAIDHAKAAEVPIVVAVNKIDKDNADPGRVRQDLMKYDLIPEEWGGDTQFCDISCKTGEGIDKLLETVILVAEMKELLANPDRDARGTIIEAQLDKGRGPVATVLIQNGTLHTGDNFISGTVTGKVRAMLDDRGRIIKSAGPSSAVFVLGFDDVPDAGENFYSVSPQLMKQVMDERKRTESDERAKSRMSVSLDELFGQIAEGNLKTLNLIIKADVQGSVEAIKQSVVKLSNEEVTVKVIHGGAGAINDSDVMLAESANAIILGFNVRPDSKAKAHADQSHVEVKTYRVIYDLLDDMEAALKGMITPKYRDVYLGKCEVRQTFRITGVGNVAGCYVLDGKVTRGGKLRIYRDDVLVVEGGVQQLKRFKDDVREVAAGYECGVSIEGFGDIKVGDIIECYTVEQIPV
ncbi:MAG: translation initiation factor IF-2 [Clostridia bacterium]|nr:translation initiation factor IF-2 [Clostridia bacterium]